MSELEKFLLFFERIYVISLAKRADRRSALLDSLMTAGVSESFINEKFKLHVPDPRIGEHPARGCYASHASICNECLNENVKTVLILEDDARVINNVQPGLIRQINLFDWDIIYLGGNPGTDLHKIDINLVKAKDMLTTHALVYNQKAMKTVVENFSNKEYFYPIDQMLKLKQDNELNCLGISPMMFNQSSGFSDVERYAVDYWFITDSYRRHAELSTLDASKHEKVKVGFFIECKEKDIPALKISILSLASQKYSNFEIIVVSTEKLSTIDTQQNLKYYVGSLEDAMKNYDGHVCCNLPCGTMVHNGVCFTIVQDYRMAQDDSAICTNLVFSYDKKIHKKERTRFIPWVAEI